MSTSVQRTLTVDGKAEASANRGQQNELRVTGRLEVPRLGFSVAVVDGDEEKGLGVAAVHLAETPAPGAPGNSVIAGHRDSAFWPLRDLRVGDAIRMRGGHNQRFAVRSIRVVEPDDISVMKPTADGAAVLTLITCYPFRYVGSAPKRFVVRAARIS